MMRRDTMDRPMRLDDLMKPDLLSEVLLLGGGIAIAVSFLMVIVATLASWLLPS
jgi:hypothetical protein